MKKPIDDYTLIEVKDAAALLNITARLVRRMISEPCPDCEGPMIEKRYQWRKTTNECPTCFGTGRRLPAYRFAARAWIVISEGLENDHIKNRQVGRPKNK